jgi:L-seryl-tRNA(Ser) seleniumtransferase
MSLRDLPSVDSLLKEPLIENLVNLYGHSLTVRALRECLDAARRSVRQGDQAVPIQWSECVNDRLSRWLTPSLKPVVNATGVILHTNLGRAPLSQAAQSAVREIAAGYSALEFDLASGERGQRQAHVESLLVQLTGAEAGMVVNNNAAAVLLGLTALAQGRQVLISRSQLVEIGGGFRVPEVMAQSGAEMVEVGTTNRTHIQDFERALGDTTALIVRAHHSNFRLTGFTAEPSLGELVALGDAHRMPVLDDLGSGALLDTSDFGLGHEPMVQESLLAGASLVTFSGDKLLGGPQAGLIVGREDIVGRLRRHPLARAIRPDKLCLAALGPTLEHYLRREAVSHVPVWQMISRSADEIRGLAEEWAGRLGQGEVSQGDSTVGGGSLPEETLPTWLLTLSVEHPQAFLTGLRKHDPPVIGRVKQEQVCLDPRTVLPGQEGEVLGALEAALAEVAPGPSR